ncbi:MAG: tetratricopeptide repeat protein [Candidatus Cloacimonetes bacterium]|nr:tetratricopeptide repeat protein [Candidatus Cloacimonadota bacterium]
MILLAIVIIGVSFFCFSKGYIFIGIWTLLGGFSKKIGFVVLTVTSVFLFIKGHIIVGLFPLLIIIWNLVGLHLAMYGGDNDPLKNLINAIFKRKPGIVYKNKENYNKAIDIDPEGADAYYNMGIAYYNKGNYDKAIDCYQKAIDIDPDLSDAYNNMGIAYGDKDNYDKEIECYQKAIEVKSDYADAYYNMGIAYSNKDNDISASDSFYQAGLLYLEQNKRESALKILDLMNVDHPYALDLTQKLMDKLFSNK